MANDTTTPSHAPTIVLVAPAGASPQDVEALARLAVERCPEAGTVFVLPHGWTTAQIDEEVARVALLAERHAISEEIRDILRRSRTEDAALSDLHELADDLEAPRKP